MTALVQPTTALPGKIVPAGRTPRIGDLVQDAVIYRWSRQRHQDMVSELPCHPTQMANITHTHGGPVEVDQLVVCRTCFTLYAATPVPSTNPNTQPKIVYRHLGSIAMSRPKRTGE